MLHRFKCIPGGSFFILAIVLVSCATVAVTGRRQLILVSAPEVMQMAAQQYSTVISQGPLSKNASQTAMVKRVGLKIQKAVEDYMASQGRSSELTGFNWEFNLIDDPKIVNAWCMPGGKVAFYTAILPVCKDEDGVAVVMGHEVAHAIANHGAERMSDQLVAQLGLEAVSGALGSNPILANEILLQAVGMGTELGLLKFSRTHESEADHMGLIFMAMAGYDPSHAPEFWKRMASLSGGSNVPEFMSTHPSDETRIADLNRKMPEALKYYKPVLK
jgi:predicted Zn-dependent protease